MLSYKPLLAAQSTVCTHVTVQSSSRLPQQHYRRPPSACEVFVQIELRFMLTGAVHGSYVSDNTFHFLPQPEQTSLTRDPTVWVLNVGRGLTTTWSPRL